MPTVADSVDVVVGGDTHRDVHVLEMVTPTGVTIATTTIVNTDAGFAQALAWITDHAPDHAPDPDPDPDHAPDHAPDRASGAWSGANIVVGLEGTRSYGIGLARAFAAAGITVVEVEQPRRADRRRRGKSDPIDAHLAALQVLRLDVDRLPVPRTDGDREALRILLSARREMVVTRTRAINRLRALLLSGDDTDRDLARGRLTTDRLSTITRRRGRASDTTEQTVRRGEAHRLAHQILTLDRDLATNKRDLTTIVTTFCPALLDLHGVGPVCAAQAIVSWSHPGRCRTEAAYAAYAALAGASPIPASSGQTVRHRLNRGGDRALNRALHDIVLTRWRTCPTTHAYITRRRAEGHTDPEIRRNLKRYTARQLYRTLNTHTTT